VSLRFHLNNLDFNETSNYIHHRLRVAGCPREDVFTENAVSALFRETGGVPREINRVCKLALDQGAASKLAEIDADVVEMILADIKRHR
jgi:general secretion pathway protein A